jgi:hypothetical protein
VPASYLPAEQTHGSQPSNARRDAVHVIPARSPRLTAIQIAKELCTVLDVADSRFVCAFSPVLLFVSDDFAFSQQGPGKIRDIKARG